MPTRPVKALATDYDGTLAHGGSVAPVDVRALERLRARGVRTILVTGRQLDDLGRVFPRLDLFDAVVAENGGVLATADGVRALAEPPPAAVLDRLAAAGVAPLGVGRVVIAAGAGFLETIRRAGIDRDIILNKGTLMLLPRGVDKGTGLEAALAALGVAASETVGIGDAENDLPFLERCGRAVAVTGALPEVMARAAALVPGVAALVDALL